MDPNPLRLAAAQAEERAPKLVHRGIAERRPAKEPHRRSGAEADFPEASAGGAGAGYLGNLKQPPVASVGHVGQGSVHFGPGEYQFRTELARVIREWWCRRRDSNPHALRGAGEKRAQQVPAGDAVAWQPGGAGGGI